MLFFTGIVPPDALDYDGKWLIGLQYSAIIIVSLIGFVNFALMFVISCGKAKLGLKKRAVKKRR